MMKIAVVFPGQGAQYPGMGKELAEYFPCAKQIYKVADQILGFSLSDICFEGDREELERTEVTQAAILTTSLAIYEILLEKGITPVMVAGLSLGEYSALVAGNMLSFEDALPLVIKRGQIMQEAVPRGQGMMAAVLGDKAKKVEEICNKVQRENIVEIANYNCPGQIVISGDKQGVLKAGELLKNEGAKFLPLAVSVPSHSSLMREAAKKLAQELEKIAWSEPNIPIISNVKAKEVKRYNLPQLLVEQLYKPVRWEQTITNMSKEVDCFIEVGPGKILSGLIRKTVKDKALGSVQDLASLKKILKGIEEDCNER